MFRVELKVTEYTEAETDAYGKLKSPARSTVLVKAYLEDDGPTKSGVRKKIDGVLDGAGIRGAG